jgi:5-methylcytosine-specific restriction endonuclease McrA
MAYTHNINSRDRRAKVNHMRQKQKDMCAYCGKRMLFDKAKSQTRMYRTIDHIIPTGHKVWKVVPGSPNRMANLVLACLRCNCNVIVNWPLERKLLVVGRTFEECLEYSERCRS